MLQNKKPLSTALIFDDHELFAASFAKTLGETGTFKEVHYFSSSLKLIDHLMNDRGSFGYVLFLDYYLAEEKTIIPFIKDLRTHKKINTKIIIVTSAESGIVFHELMQVNVDGILSKSSNVQDIYDCIAALDADEKFYSELVLQQVRNTPIPENSLLSAREIEILGFFALGLTVNQTADKLNLSRHTVAAHRRKMFAKTKSTNITDMLNYARQTGLIH